MHRDTDHADVNLDNLDRWIDLCIAEGWGGFEATARQAHDEIVRSRKAREQHQQSMQQLSDDLWNRTVDVLRNLPMSAGEHKTLVGKLSARWQQVEESHNIGVQTDD